jgi:hypothetical protein
VNARIFLVGLVLRDEGTSHHYLPEQQYVEIPEKMLTFYNLLKEGTENVVQGGVWTTDAPSVCVPDISHQ